MFRTVALIVLIASGPVAAYVDSSAPHSTGPAGGPVTASVAYSTPVEAAPAPLDDHQAALVAWAQGRFEEAGLSLPEIAVEFDPTRERCGGAEGIYRFDGTSHRVAICTRESSSFAAELLYRRTLLHEFAHAWETASFDDNDRHRLNRRFGTSAWADPGDAWTSKGAEHLAETIVFGLLDQTHRELRIDRSCDDLVEDFEAVTGTTVLGPDLPPCLRG